MKTGDPWLLPPYVEMDTWIFVVLMAQTMTARESFQQPIWHFQIRYYTNNTHT